MLVEVRAANMSRSLLGSGTEAAQGTVDALHPTLAFTIGANLQSPANVMVQATGRSLQVERIFLEMRRRSLCYRPISASPLFLYLGGGDIAAESYPFARTFQSEADRPYAGMGALLPNPDYHPPARAKWHLNKASRLTIALAAFATLLLFNARRLLRKMKGPAQ